jgi:hypothetical protein
LREIRVHEELFEEHAYLGYAELLLDGIDTFLSVEIRISIQWTNSVSPHQGVCEITRHYLAELEWIEDTIFAISKTYRFFQKRSIY